MDSQTRKKDIDSTFFPSRIDSGLFLELFKDKTLFVFGFELKNKIRDKD